MSSASSSAHITSAIPPAPPRSLSIALLGYRSHPHVGGQGIYLQYLSKALVDLGHQVDVISGPPYPELDPRVRLIELPSLDLYAHPDPLRALRWRHLRSWADTYEWWSKLSGAFGEPYCFGRRLVRYVKRENPHYDLVHDNQSLCDGLLALERRGYTVAATVHHPITRDRDLALAATTDKKQQWFIRRWYSFVGMQARVIKQLRHVITVSECSRRDIADAFKVDANRIDVIPNGVDTDVFRPLPHIAREPFRLLTTASSDQPLKGLSVLLRALKHITVDYPKITLTVIGKINPDGDTANELDALALTDHVEFISGLSTEDVVTQYARAQMAIVPSLYEGFGLPAAEALACGVGLISSDGGALPEVVGDAASLVPAGDVSALANAIRTWLENPQACADAGQRGREHSLRALSWSCVAKRMQDYYFDIIDERARPRAHH